MDEYVSVQQTEANLTTSFGAKMNKALPAKKVARYLQSENKIKRGDQSMIWRPHFLWLVVDGAYRLAVPIEWTHMSTAVGIL